mmetsp:Transcript_9124/g.22487  ORF Transcript_9124/g.22487 Transcript_9124/m.22487 type:complete len:298 (-) Transcript_9124:136-1029(-)
MNVWTSSSMLSIPVAALICWNASSKLWTRSSEACWAALSLATFQLPLARFFRSDPSSSAVIRPRSWPAMRSLSLRSCSKTRPNSRHSCSNCACSLSACALRSAISLCAWSRASYAMLEISMIWAISFFFSCSSLASFALIWSNTTRSRRRLSISSRSCLLNARASLNLTSALSSRFSSTRICFDTALSDSFTAFTPPRFCWSSRVRTCMILDCFSRSSSRRFSTSILRVYRSLVSWRDPRRLRTWPSAFCAEFCDSDASCSLSRSFSLRIFSMACRWRLMMFWDSSLYFWRSVSIIL